MRFTNSFIMKNNTAADFPIATCELPVTDTECTHWPDARRRLRELGHVSCLTHCYKERNLKFSTWTEAYFTQSLPTLKNM